MLVPLAVAADGALAGGATVQYGSPIAPGHGIGIGAVAAEATWVHAFVAAIFAFLFGPCIGIAVGYYGGHFDCGGQDAREPVS